MSYLKKLGVAGAGNMAYSIIAGALKSGLLTADDIMISDKYDTAFKRFNKLDSRIGNILDNSYLFQNCEYILLAVKPQSFKEMYMHLADCKAKCIISIMAGIDCETIRKYANGQHVIRVMPNTPAMIGKGVSAITETDAGAEAKEFAEKLFLSVGDTVYLPEDKFDAVTALSGSGPAYVFQFIDAIIKTGVGLGLEENTARLLTTQTFAGAAELVKASADKTLSELISDVKSKGGTTEAALNAFDKNGLSDIIHDGVVAAAARSEELRIAQKGSEE